jgi:hypothetical protein
MDFSKIGGLLEQIAPTIATAVGGPLAGMAVKTLSTAIFGHPDGSPEDVQAAMMNATPDQLIAVKNADYDFQVQMEQIGVDLEKIAAGDRDSARQMQIATKDWVPRLLAMVVTLGFFGILIFMLTNGMPEKGTEALAPRSSNSRRRKGTINGSQACQRSSLSSSLRLDWVKA